MPRELITIQVGQCGNQIGTRFWDLALREHALANPKGIFEESMSSFFRNVEATAEGSKEIPVGDGTSKIKGLKARAVLVDMEEGVLNEILKTKELGDLFDSKNFISDTSGSGNNWAHGHEEYGPLYEEKILEQIRRQAEFADSLQSFLLLHSLGGGTGSGVGTYILPLLEDHYPEVYRFTSAVFPSEDDDVITSPYNSVLSLGQLIQHSDCVLPIDNQSLMEITNRIHVKSSKSLTSETQGKPFDAMNNIAAHLLLNLTCSMRFGGALNVDLNEITTNLVPFPKMHFLVSSLTPLYSLANSKILPRTMDQMFTDAFSKEFQLIRADPRRSTYLACGMVVRGAVEVSELRRNVERLMTSQQLQFVGWNREGWKVGLCSAPPLHSNHALLCLANNSCIKNTFQELFDRFKVLYKRKAHLHHYTKYMKDTSLFDESAESILSVMDAYAAIDKQVNIPDTMELKRLKPVV